MADLEPLEENDMEDVDVDQTYTENDENENGKNENDENEENENEPDENEPDENEGDDENSNDENENEEEQEEDEQQADTNDADAGSGETTDKDLAQMKRLVKEMEEEAAKIEAMQNEVQDQLKPASDQNGPDVDERSIYVGNVDYAVTPEELQSFFQACGTVNRITIICDKYSGHPKGFAYIEFASRDAVNNAMLLNEEELRGRQIKVARKRTNVPGMSKSRGRRGGRRGRGFRPRYGGGGGGGGGGYYGPRFRSRGRMSSYHPYY